VTLDHSGSVRAQYRDSSHFSARVDLHARYSTNPVGWTRWIFDKVAVGPGECVLEVGCGPGHLWRGSTDRLPSDSFVVASDYSQGMAAEAARAIADARFAFASTDAQALPFADETFDAVVGNHMLYHVPDLDTALEEFGRVLRPNGRLLAATNGPQHFKEVRDILDIHWRYVDQFGLENGPERIARHFDNVTVERYPDTLHVPAAEPVIAYVKSMSSFWDLSDELASKLRSEIDAAIARDGFFNISKDSGVITASRR
jgi:SAM-dependent methyltransferase